jgi:hypothetical protein
VERAKKEGGVEAELVVCDWVGNDHLPRLRFWDECGRCVSTHSRICFCSGRILMWTAHTKKVRSKKYPVRNTKTSTS